MRNKTRLIKSWSWLIIFGISDLFFIFLVYLSSPANFVGLSAIIILFTVIAVFAGIYFDKEHRIKKRELLEKFLKDKDMESQWLLESEEDAELEDTIIKIGDTLREQQKKLNEKETALRAYEEYIESWAHEIKTPLSLAVLVLDNHKAEMSPYVYKRMEFVRHSIGSDVESILYYARLHTDHPDFRFERVDLKEAVEESLEDFRLIADENNINLQLGLSPYEAVTDKKVLIFIISQLLSNAVKYTAKENGIVEIKIDRSTDGLPFITIMDNGEGVPKEDLPFIFDRGFTGSSAKRQKATGMGLYLVKKYSDALNVTVNAENIGNDGCGFKVTLTFPQVK